MPKRKQVMRAWIDKRNHQIYLKVGKRWYEHGGSYDECPSSVRWMARHCRELHPREAARLNAERVKEMGRE